MRLLPQIRDRYNSRVMQERVVWQAASLLLAYPDDGLPGRLDTVDELLSHISGPAGESLGRTVAALRRCATVSRWPPRWTTSRPSTCGGAPRCT